MHKIFSRALVFFLFLFCFEPTFSQDYYYKGNVVAWAEMPGIVGLSSKPSDPAKSTIFDDHLDVRFGTGNSAITRLITYYVASEKDAADISTHKFPDNFDEAYSEHMQTQGRKDLNKGVDVDAFSLQSFGARAYRNGTWQLLELDYKFVKRRWLLPNGEMINDEMPVILIKGLKPDCYVQIYYSAKFEGMYGQNIFYLNSKFPKQSIDYYFEYKVPKTLAAYRFCGPFNMADSCFTETKEFSKDEIAMKMKIKMGNLKAINYTHNAREADALPHVVFDFFTINAVKQVYHDNGNAVYDYVAMRPKNFEWISIADTSVGYDKIYIKHFAALRKFLKAMPPLKADSGALGFLKVYRDSLVNYRYISNNQIAFNEEHLRDVGLFDHLAKRRLPEQHDQLLQELLWETGRFYYRANVMDKRFGIHSPLYRAHFAYEHSFTIVPENNLYHLYLGRPNGVKYYANELPYYFEGAVAKLSPLNFSASDTAKASKISKFIRLHEGTANENTRVENALAQIDLSKNEIDLKGKLSLSGQYSTILRHYYYGDPIDSTIAVHYFKKCLDKPMVKEKMLKTASKSSEYPFRTSFNYAEKLALSKTTELNLSNWFSFVLNKSVLPAMPSHDYYFDFTFSDVYNYVLSFSKPVDISNSHAFKKSLSNRYFELQSEILKQDDGTFLAKVNLQVKEPRIQLADMQLLQDMLIALDEINNFKCEVKAL